MNNKWIEIYNEMKDDGEFDGIVPHNSQEAVEDVIAGLSVLPSEALFMGMAYDEKPYLLNLHDPLPGAIALIGDNEDGKRNYLKMIACAIYLLHKPEHLEFGVITNDTKSWKNYYKIPNCIGVFSCHDTASEDLLLSLASWAHGNKTSRQSVVLLIDGLEDLVRVGQVDAIQNLRYLLLRGAERRVWTIASMSAESSNGFDDAWYNGFITIIYVHMSYNRQFGSDLGQCGSLAPFEFITREGNSLLKFWSPRPT